MILTAQRVPSLDFCAAILALGLAAVAIPQLGFAQMRADAVTEAATQGRWIWSQDHWVWAEKPLVDIHGTDISETGVASHSAPLHEAGLTLRRTIALAMSAP